MTLDDRIKNDLEERLEGKPIKSMQAYGKFCFEAYNKL